jgi:hypothetical protein
MTASVSGEVLAPATKSELARMVSTIERTEAIHLMLWILTALLAFVAIGWWVLFSGAAPVERALALRALWPLALIWVGALLLWGRMINEARREVIRADAMIELGTRTAQVRHAAMAAAPAPPSSTREAVDRAVQAIVTKQEEAR